MPQMRAISQDRLGDPDVMQVVEAARPEPGPTEVLVRVAAAGVNPVDWKVRRGGGLLSNPPFTVGWDVAGTVEALGAGVTRFRTGDRVLGMPRFPKEAAAYAEYVTGPSRHFAAIPDGLTDAEAAALPLAGLTAWQALVDTAAVGPGDHVLVLAAAGGVGHLAIQIAKARGADVTGTARAVHHEWLRGLGADEVIDYTTQDVTHARAADVVLDLVGGPAGRDAAAATKDGGLFITIPSGADLTPLRELAADRFEVRNMLVEPDHAALEALTGLIGQGRLQVRVSRNLALSDAPEAHRLGEAGEIGGGKLVLIP